MKKFACGDVVPGCTATFQGPTDDEILGQVAKHAHDDHGLKDISADLVAAVKNAIRESDTQGGA